MSDVGIALLIFGLAYLAIITERVHKTIAAVLGATLMIVLGVLTQEEAFHSPRLGIDYNVIFLLIGMMIIVNIIRQTGLFEWLAIWAAKRAKARPFRMLVLLSLITALLSALLDNVTTVLLMAPVTLELTRKLALDPIPYLISEALASNIGGTATLVGDPPNIMIASKAALGYLDFLMMLAPITAVIMAVYLLVLWGVSRRGMTVAEHRQQAVLALNERATITDARLLRQCLVLLALTTLGFCFHGVLHVEPATVALLGAALFMLAGEGASDSAERGHLGYLAEVEWKTIFFFIGLFILVGGLVKVGVIREVANQLVVATRGNMEATTLTVLWGSAILSAIVDNIPYVAAMNPLILDLAGSLHPTITDPIVLAHHPDILPLWWALALGACLGGNGTMIGATANVVIVDMAYREGHRISFWQFLSFGLPVMLGSLVLSTLYLWLRFF
jgi:Na+/H+ antiporter NhaD/arsenite permease-like protein